MEHPTLKSLIQLYRLSESLKVAEELAWEWMAHLDAAQPAEVIALVESENVGPSIHQVLERMEAKGIACLSVMQLYREELKKRYMDSVVKAHNQNDATAADAAKELPQCP